MPSSPLDETRQTFIAFREECIWLQTCFNTFQALYSGGQSIESLLQRSAPAFFADLNIVLVEYWVLIVSRLTDPAITLGRENLTAKFLVQALGQLGLLTPEIEATAKGLQNYRSLVNEARNRLVSHADRSAFLQAAALGQHSEAAVGQFVRDLQRFNDLVGEAVGEGPLDYQITSGPGDVYDLLRVLKGAA